MKCVVGEAYIVGEVFCLGTVVMVYVQSALSCGPATMGLRGPLTLRGVSLRDTYVSPTFLPFSVICSRGGG